MKGLREIFKNAPADQIHISGLLECVQCGTCLPNFQLNLLIKSSE